MAADQCTMFYTSEGDSIRRFDVCANAQLADFCIACGAALTGMRIASNGDVFVADAYGSSVRRFDSSGAQIQVYTASGFVNPFAFNLDPDGTSFWTGDISTGEIFKFDITSGAVLLQFNSAPFTSLAGLAVFGEIVVGRETDCTDGIDNDRDGLIDCADPDCALDPACVATTTTTVATTTTTTTTTSTTTTTTVPVTGRMTRGGTERTKTGKAVTFNGGTRAGVTQGLVLHCKAASLPNSLEVNSPGNIFHLTTLQTATCSSDGMGPQPPPAGFDVLKGSGTGRCNGLAATANFKFADHGEPGTNDTAEIHITGGCSLDITGNLRGGDLQALQR